MNYIINYDFLFDLPQISKEWPKNGLYYCLKEHTRRQYYILMSRFTIKFRDILKILAHGQMSCSRGFSREGEGPIYYKVREVYFETSLSFSLSDSLTCLTEYCTQKDTSFPSI
ncbi:hypothetical protein AAHE18_07G103500 [Arachis hypogaea]